MGGEFEIDGVGAADCAVGGDRGCAAGAIRVEREEVDRFEPVEGRGCSVGKARLACQPAYGGGNFYGQESRRGETLTTDELSLEPCLASFVMPVAGMAKSDPDAGIDDDGHGRALCLSPLCGYGGCGAALARGPGDALGEVAHGCEVLTRSVDAISACVVRIPRSEDGNRFASLGDDVAFVVLSNLVDDPRCLVFQFPDSNLFSIRHVAT